MKCIFVTVVMDALPFRFFKEFAPLYPIFCVVEDYVETADLSKGFQ